MPTPFSGGCACGAVRYDCSAEPLLSFNCHCRDCQRTSGSAFALVLMVPTGAFTITKGTPRYYRVTGGVCEVVWCFVKKVLSGKPSP